MTNTVGERERASEKKIERETKVEQIENEERQTGWEKEIEPQ